MKGNAMSLLDALGAAAHRELRAQEELRAARAAKDEALRAIWQAGFAKCHVAEMARFDLSLHGFDAEMISRLALSDASVRLVLDRT